MGNEPHPSYALRAASTCVRHCSRAVDGRRAGWHRGSPTPHDVCTMGSRDLGALTARAGYIRELHGALCSLRRTAGGATLRRRTGRATARRQVRRDATNPPDSYANPPRPQIPLLETKRHRIATKNRGATCHVHMARRRNDFSQYAGCAVGQLRGRFTRRMRGLLPTGRWAGQVAFVAEESRTPNRRTRPGTSTPRARCVTPAKNVPAGRNVARLLTGCGSELLQPRGRGATTTFSPLPQDLQRRQLVKTPGFGAGIPARQTPIKHGMENGIHVASRWKITNYSQ